MKFIKYFFQQSILEKYCPDIAAGGSVCCDAAQLGNFDKSIGVAVNLLSRCPTCLDNFLKHICSMTCAPNQSSFLQAKKYAPFNGKRNCDLAFTNHFIQELSPNIRYCFFILISLNFYRYEVFFKLK